MKSSYERPAEIPMNMGGVGDSFDERLAIVRDLVEQAPLDSMTTILDIGMGQGQLLKWLSKKGKRCFGTGLEFASYGLDVDGLKRDYGISCIECGAEKMPFADQQFDGVIMSHVLEHCYNVGSALAEARRVLADKGWLMLMVPPYEDRVCAGHVSIGWSIGQLMYVLLLNGFDVKNGRFIKYGYNVCAFVQRSEVKLPPLRCDRGDIIILQKAGLFPAPIMTADGFNDGFFGDLIAFNWDPEFVKNAVLSKRKNSRFRKLFQQIGWKLPANLRQKIANKLDGGGRLLREDLASKINPPILKG